MLYRSKSLRLVAWGDLGSFTKTEFRSDRVTHAIIPPTAAEGVFKSIFWHPEAKIQEGARNELGVEVQEIWVLNPISYIRLRMSELAELPSKDSPCLVSPRQTSVLALKDPKYLLVACYVARSEDVAQKAARIYEQRMGKGQCFRQPCFGRRRYPAFVREATEEDRPIDVDLDLGRFPWNVQYTDGHKQLHVFDAKIRRGVLVVPSYFDSVEKQGDEVRL